MAYYNSKSSTMPLAPSPGQWTTSLCDCSEDVSSSCVGCFCPCVMFGRNAEIISRGTTSCCKAGLKFSLLGVFGCVYTGRYRSKLRAHHSLLASPCSDCLVHTFCKPLALCQEHRELKNRGFDPMIGWAANADMLMHQAMKPPNMSTAMMR